MRRFALLCLGFWPYFLVSGSYRAWDALDPVSAAAIPMQAIRLNERVTMVNPPLFFLGAWQLRSRDSAFGGLSALVRDSGQFTALADTGIVFRFSLSRQGGVTKAAKAPLPAGCTRDDRKTSRDTESLSFLPRSGDALIGFEWYNRLCRAGHDLARAQRVSAPAAMRRFPATGGAEAMAALQDGRVIVIAERSGDASAISPIMIFDRDPTQASARWGEAAYRPPAGYRPTDVAQLPDGRLIIVNRRFDFPYQFSAKLTIVDLAQLQPGRSVRGRIVAVLTPPGLADNFEGVAVSQSAGRTFVWLVSDDNLSPLQRTLLLLFELRAAAAQPG